MATSAYILASATHKPGMHAFVREGATRESPFGKFRTYKIREAKVWRTRGGAENFAKRYPGMAGPGGWQVVEIGTVGYKRLEA